MSATRCDPARPLTTFMLVLGLTFGLLAFSTVGPATPGASALISAQKGNAAVEWAQTRKGSPYAYGGVGPRRFDCSGLTRWVFARVGKSLPHSSAAQAGKVKRISRSNARRGDLVFFYGGGGVYHVGIYAGRGQIWHASVPGTPVKRDAIWSSNVFFGRVR